MLALLAVTNLDAEEDCNDRSAACGRPEYVYGNSGKSGISGTEVAIIAAGVVAIAGLFVWYKTDWFNFSAAPNPDGVDLRVQYRF